MGISLFDERSPWSASIVLDETSGTNQTYFAETSGSAARIDSLIAVSSASTDRVLVVQFNGQGSCPLGRYTIPAGAGMSAAVPPFHLLAQIVAVGVLELVLPQMAYFELSLTESLAPGESITLVAIGGNV